MAIIGFTAGLSGMTGYWVLFALIIFMMVASNTAQGAQQGLIPDLVPENQRGRFSGVKAILEIPLPLIIISFTVGRVIGSGNMWGGILITMGILAVSMLLTLFVPEKRLGQTPPSIDWKPFIRLALMTGLFTIIILAMGKFSQVVIGAFARLTTSLDLAVTAGLIGLASMLVAVALGVWMSVRVGVGSDIHANPSFTWWVVNRLAFLVGANNLASFTVYFLQGRLGYQGDKAATPAAFLTMFVGVFILISAIPSGWLADRFGHKRLVVFSGFVAAVGTLIALLVPSLTIIYIGGSVIGIAIGIFYSANWALGTDIVPKDQAGRYLGIANLAGAGAGAIGAFIGGPIADLITRQVPEFPGLGYVLLFAIYGSLFLFSTLALRGVQRKELMAQPSMSVSTKA
jgi:MFS family permease